MLRSGKISSGFISFFSRSFKVIAKRILLVLLILVSTVIIFFSSSNSEYIKDARSNIVDYTTPVVEIAYYPFTLYKNLKYEIQNYFNVKNKNRELRKANAKLRQELLLLYQLYSENQRLRKLLNFIRESDFEAITARVISDTSSPFIKSILINAGKKDGITKGQAVITTEGLVGRIIETGEKTSRILLVTDINSNIPVITEKSRERGIASGDNTELPQLEYIFNSGDLKNGELVFTSGDGDVFPFGIPIGRIVFSENGKYKLKPLVNWNKLDYINILTPVNNS